MSAARLRSGGCQCGAVRYAIDGAPLAPYACHCRECWRQPGSAFGLSLAVPRTGLRLTQGEPRVWTRPADSGRRIRCAFCPQCGSRLWHERADASPTLMIKAGSLDEPVDLGAAIHLLDLAQAARRDDPGRRPAVRRGAGLAPFAGGGQFRLGSPPLGCHARA